jgi:ribosomal protein S18 acetylase RimI-like enzyme
VPVAIRRAEPADAAAVAALASELRAHLGDPPGHLTPERIVADGFGERPEFAILLALLDDVPAGYALFHDAYEPAYAARGAYLCDLYVRPAGRRRGIGRALIGAVAAETAARGRRYVWWVSQRRNAEAQAFYDRLGAIRDPVVAHVFILDGTPLPPAPR